jgi:hypothetical protein
MQAILHALLCWPCMLRRGLRTALAFQAAEQRAEKRRANWRRLKGRLEQVEGAADMS